MPSTTRGSILISTANDIGEALVEKLGGVGYSPNEWKNNINLCGIAPVDSAPALSVLSDSAGTGDERGSILIATADAIGAILNKKYNVLRGFKPKEWASACRKMKALESGSVASSSIASFSDGADGVPLTSCVCNIDANLDGKTAVVCSVVDGEEYLYGATVVQGGFNINNGNDYSSTTRLRTNNYIPITSGSYTIENNQSYEYVVYVYDETNAFIDAESIKTWQTYGTPFSINGNRHIRIGWRKSDNSTITADEISGYHCYKVGTKTTKTADLGRAVYGGSADIIKGEGSEQGYKVVVDGTNFYFAKAGNYYNSYPRTLPTLGTPWKLIQSDNISFGYNSNYGGFIFLTVARAEELGLYSAEEVNAYFAQNPSTLILNLATPTDFTFEPVKIDSFPGVNNIWNDCGDTSAEYYKSPTPYTRKTATGGIANFSDQRTDLPLTKAIANIAPSIAGKSAVNLVRAGKNLFDKENPNVVDGYITTTGFSTSSTSAKTVYIPIVGGATYTVSKTAGQRFQIATSEVEPTNNAVFTSRQAGNTSTSLTITASANDKYLWAWIFLDGTDSGTLAEMLNSIQIEVGSTASTFEPYQAPTTYTAELGETVYGGSVDFVSGEVVKDCAVGSMSSSYLSGLSSDYIGYEASTAYFENHPSIWVRNWNYQTAAPRTAGGIKCTCNEFPVSMHNTTIFAAQYRIYFDVNEKNISSVQDFIDYVANLEQNGKQLEIAYEIATPTESTIPGRVISPIEGVNNYRNDAGGDTEIEYFEEESEG